MNQTLILVIIALQQDFFFPVCMWGLCVCVCGEGWGNSITLRPEKDQMSLAVGSEFSRSLKLPNPS